MEVLARTHPDREEACKEVLEHRKLEKKMKLHHCQKLEYDSKLKASDVELLDFDKVIPNKRRQTFKSLNHTEAKKQVGQLTIN